MGQRDRQVVTVHNIQDIEGTALFYPLSIDSFEGDLSTTIVALNEILQAATALGYSDVGISIDVDKWEPGDITVRVYGRRLETDAEWSARQAKIRADRKAKSDARKKLQEQDSADYQKYLELKERFES